MELERVLGGVGVRVRVGRSFGWSQKGFWVEVESESEGILGRVGVGVSWKEFCIESVQVGVRRNFRWSWSQGQKEFWVESELHSESEGIVGGAGFEVRIRRNFGRV
jgi:hypothetical protein